MIHAKTKNGCLTLTIDRVDKANALSEAMLIELTDHIEASKVSVLVLTGAGSVFSAGADLNDVRNGSLATSPEWERLSGAVAGFKGLSVAALNGTVAGGAMGMVLACDLRVAVSGAKFFYPVITIGVLPQPSDPARLSALVGPAMAKRILMTGAKISAPEALRCGLLDVICEEGLMAEVEAIIAPAIAAQKDHLVAIKEMIG